MSQRGVGLSSLTFCPTRCRFDGHCCRFDGHCQEAGFQKVVALQTVLHLRRLSSAISNHGRLKENFCTDLWGQLDGSLTRWTKCLDGKDLVAEAEVAVHGTGACPLSHGCGKTA